MNLIEKSPTSIKELKELLAERAKKRNLAIMTRLLNGERKVQVSNEWSYDVAGENIADEEIVEAKLNGRPKAFTSVADFKQIANKYFHEECGDFAVLKMNNKLEEEIVIENHPPQIGNLCKALDVSDRTLQRYRKDDYLGGYFCRPTERLFEVIMSIHEHNLIVNGSKGCGGTIFALRNFGWNGGVQKIDMKTDNKTEYSRDVRIGWASDFPEMDTSGGHKVVDPMIAIREKRARERAEAHKVISPLTISQTQA